MFLKLTKKLAKFRSDMETLGNSDEHFHAYFTLLPKYDLRQIDNLLLLHIFKKKDINLEQNFEEFVQDKAEYCVRDPAVWNSNSWRRTFHETQKQLSNRHADCHEQRIYLQEQGIRQVYHCTSRELTRQKNVKVAYISPASETYHRTWNKNTHVNCCLTNDPNDETRAVRALYQLIKITPPEDMELVFTNFCTCYQNTECCDHITNMQPDLVFFPHSIYYIKDELINSILDMDAKIMFTAHIFEGGSDGKIGDMVTWSCRMNHVKFNVKDDKTYEHKNFMPLLYHTKNVTTNKTVTKVLGWFEHPHCIHCVGTIDGSFQGENDFHSRVLDIERAPYVLGTRGCLESAGEHNEGTVFLKKDGDEKFMVRVLKTTVQCFTFRGKNMNFYDKFFSGRTNNLRDDKYTDIANRFYIEYPEMCVEISNGMYNLIFTRMFNIPADQLDHEKFKNLFMQVQALIGNTSTSLYMYYVILKNVLFDVLLANVMVSDLAKSKIVTMIKQFPQKEGILDKIQNLFVNPIQIDENFNVVNHKQTYNEASSTDKTGICTTVKESVVHAKKQMTSFMDKAKDNLCLASLVEAVVDTPEKEARKKQVDLYSTVAQAINGIPTARDEHRGLRMNIPAVSKFVLGSRGITRDGFANTLIQKKKLDLNLKERPPNPVKQAPDKKLGPKGPPPSTVVIQKHPTTKTNFVNMPEKDPDGVE